MSSDHVTKVILSTIKEHFILSIGIVVAVSGAIITSIIPPLILARVIDTITRGETLPVIRGNMRRIIVVEPPDPIFSEAMFILRDDYFQTPGLSRQELLQQAQNAARNYVGSAAPPEPRQPVFLPAMSVFALGAAAAILALWVGGVI